MAYSLEPTLRHLTDKIKWIMPEFGRMRQGRPPIHAKSILGAMLICLLSLQASRASAAEPTRIDLFEARQGGYHTYRIPGIVAMKSGSLFAWVEARRTGTGDWEDIDILSRVSRDGGVTWEPARQLVDAGTKRKDRLKLRQAGKRAFRMLPGGREAHVAPVEAFARCDNLKVRQMPLEALPPDFQIPAGHGDQQAHAPIRSMMAEAGSAPRASDTV